MQDVVLNFALVTTILEHFRHTRDTTHARSKRGTNFGWVHVLVELVRVSNTRAIESLCRTDEGPERETISLSNDIFRNAITSSVPTGRNLTCDSSAELEGLRNEDAGTLFQFGKPLPVFSRPNVTLVTVLKLEFLRFGVRNLNRFKIMDELDLLVKDFLVRIVAAEKFRF